MEKYLIFNSITKQVIVKEFSTFTDCRNWIINTLDQSGDAWNMDRLEYIATEFYKENTNEPSRD